METITQPMTLTEQVEPRAPVKVREIAAVLLIVALSDITIYRGHGFSGVAALLLLAIPLFILAVPQPRLKTSFWMLTGMLLILAARLVWLGSALGVAVGLSLLIAAALALHGRRPHVLNVLIESLGTIANGYRGLLDYGAWAQKLGPQSARLQWLAFVLPLAAVAVFGALFIMANPDLVTSVAQMLQSWGRILERWWREIPIHAREVLFWLVVAWFVIGLVRPRRNTEAMSDSISSAAVAASTGNESLLYRPFRNTLVSVIVLFAAYLLFEFRTLWFREFPQGFYYAGYAHEGAAWLTTALAFATLMLSLIFRGPLVQDPRVGNLRTLAWIWSVQNLLLALTVFNRLNIYVDFNGMTRMRMVALFGTATVVVGFLLVVWKIIRNYNFAWLVRHQLAALAIAFFVFAITPIDAIVHWYNVRHVLSGDLPPAVQISSHPVNSEGVMMLTPLLDCQDEIIREGIRALFARRAIELEELSAQRALLGWTSYQAADERCLAHLQECKPKWDMYLDPRKRGPAWERFYHYAYQWY